MSSERWQRVKQLFDEVQSRHVDQRAAFLRASRDRDSSLVDEVQSLLEAYERAGQFIEPPSSAAASQFSSPVLLDGKTIGQYRILRIIGRGGMGDVYEAQLNNPHRHVALKLIRGGRFVNDHQIKLFRREVQALALLNHSGIATLYESGRTEEGQHYFAMELVEGLALTEFTRNASLSISERLVMFEKVCHAVAYAHQRGVIHRDLKPSNIIVDPNGRPKILDFGLARITESDINISTMSQEVGKIQGTLIYMSPEQAEGKSNDIDLRSDIYSLGVILFELLTNTLPYPLTGVPIAEAVRMITTEPPRKPSAINRALRGDLETIVLKALEKEPARRYQSATALAEDIRRFLDEQPILARPASLSYQLGKLIQRHKISFAIASSLFVIILASTVFAWKQSIEARSQANAALIARDEARALANFFQNSFSTAVEGRDDKFTVRELLAETAKHVGEAFAGKPQTEAMMRETIGNSQEKLGLFDAAQENLKACLDLRLRAFGESNPDVAAAHLSLGGLYQQRGRLAEAEAEIAKAIESCHSSLGAETLLADATRSLGGVRYKQGRYDEAEALMRNSIAIENSTHKPDATVLAKTMTQLAPVLHVRGRDDEAKTLFEQALALQQGIYGQFHEEVAHTLVELGNFHIERQEWSQSEKMFREALDIRMKLYGPNHPAVAKAMSNLQFTLRALGKFDEADRFQEQSADILRTTYGELSAENAQALSDFAGQSSTRGDLVSAEKYYRKALAIRRKLQGDKHRLVADLWLMIGAATKNQKKFDESEQAYSQALAINRELFGNDSIDVAKSLNNLASCYRAKGEDSKAEPLLREALGIAHRVMGERHIGTAACATNLATVYDRLERYDEAVRLFNEAIDIFRTTSEDKSLPAVAPMLGLAKTHTHMGQHASAESILNEAMKIRLKHLPPGHPDVAEIQLLLGECLMKQQRAAEAEPMLLSAYNSFLVSKTSGANSQARTAAERLAAVYEAEGKPDMAANWKAKLESATSQSVMQGGARQ